MLGTFFNKNKYWFKLLITLQVLPTWKKGISPVQSAKRLQFRPEQLGRFVAQKLCQTFSISLNRYLLFKIKTVKMMSRNRKYVLNRKYIWTFIVLFLSTYKKLSSMFFIVQRNAMQVTLFSLEQLFFVCVVLSYKYLITHIRYLLLTYFIWMA